jgi:hypothetical protein
MNHSLDILFVPAELKMGGDMATELRLEFADNVPVGGTCVLVLFVVGWIGGNTHKPFVGVDVASTPARAL